MYHRGGYLWNIGVVGSQLLNVMLRNGSPDETLSSAAGKANRKGRKWGAALCWFLNKVDPGHCEKSIEPDEGDPL